MKKHPRHWFLYCLCGASLFFGGGRSVSQSDLTQPIEKASVLGSDPEGKTSGTQHDFDFLFGSWAVHTRRLLHPLTGSNEWVEFDGTAIDKPVWNGRAQLEEFEANSPTGHIEGMTVRIYDTKSHQWSIYWANQSDGKFSLPATVGQFREGRGEFFDQEDYKGKNIFVRYTWMSSPDSPRWEQAFSPDGGKTWETNWIWTLTHMKNDSDKTTTGAN